MRSFNCPNCGAELHARLSSAKLIVCDYCDSTTFLEDEAVRLAGKKGVMHERPCLIELGKGYSHRGNEFLTIGKVRFDYGYGWWDEFWAVNDQDGMWISVDEGDIAVERPLDVDKSKLPAMGDIRVGKTIELADQTYLVSEIGSATCVGIQGELPEALAPGDRFGYAHLRRGAVDLVTLEFDKEGVQATSGYWLDPFEIEA